MLYIKNALKRQDAEITNSRNRSYQRTHHLCSEIMMIIPIQILTVRTKIHKMSVLTAPKAKFSR